MVAEEYVRTKIFGGQHFYGAAKRLINLREVLNPEMVNRVFTSQAVREELLWFFQHGHDTPRMKRMAEVASVPIEERQL